MASDLIRFTAHDHVELRPVNQKHQYNLKMIVGTVRGLYYAENELHIFLDPNITRIYEKLLQPGAKFNIRNHEPGQKFLSDFLKNADNWTGLPALN